MEIGKAPWIKELPCAITVCDAAGLILEMNDKSCENFAKYGGAELIGKNLFDCHSEKSGHKLQDIMTKKSSNFYTIEKNGEKKLIYQTPWYKDGHYQGLVEFSFVLPDEMPHFIR